MPFATKKGKPMSTDKIQEICEWFEFGLNIIPLSADKKPLPVKKWTPWLAELDESYKAGGAGKLIKDAWKNKALNVGHIVDASLFILDADTPESIKALHDLEKTHKIKANLIISTNKGQHHYFRRDPAKTYAKQQGFNSNKHPAAIDVKTGRSMKEGFSMVVLPPSPDKKVSVRECDSVDDLAEVDQNFIDAIFVHNRREPPREPKTKTEVSVHKSTGLAGEVGEILEFVNPDNDYDTWLEVLMGIHDKFKGSDEGLEIAIEWSEQTNPVAAAEVEYKWSTFKVGGGKGFGSVCEIARDNGADLSAIAAKYETQSGLGQLPAIDVDDPLAWSKEYMLSDEDVAKIADPEWIIPNLVVQGHLIIIAAKPNAGKTALMTDIAALMVRENKEVLYVNADTSGSDMKAYHAHAALNKYGAAFPSMAVGGSMVKVVDQLRGMAATNADLTKYVFIFDTLKKMTDVIQKKQLKELLDLLRRLTAMGATVICLGHCNKYRDSEGGLIFEGTGDLESDVDELIYLEAGRDPTTGYRVISTYPQKVRSAMVPISFKMDDDKYRTCIQLPNYIDIKTHNLNKEKVRRVTEENELIIDAAKDLLSKGDLPFTELKKSLAGNGVGICKIGKIIKDMDGSAWTITKHPERNNMSICSLKRD
jgi:hypothetical protein